jgi:hypothetical protein
VGGRPAAAVALRSLLQCGFSNIQLKFEHRWDTVKQLLLQYSLFAQCKTSDSARTPASLRPSGGRRAAPRLGKKRPVWRRMLPTALAQRAAPRLGSVAALRLGSLTAAAPP